MGMKNDDRGGGLPERGRQGVNPEGNADERVLPESERKFIANRRRFESSSNWSLRLAGILFAVLVLLFLISWLLD